MITNLADLPDNGDGTSNYVLTEKDYRRGYFMLRDLRGEVHTYYINSVSGKVVKGDRDNTNEED